MAVSQYICITTRAGSDATAAVQASVADLLKQDGIKAVHHATSIENPSQVWLFVDWESPEHHDRYAGSESFSSVKGQLDSVTDSSGLSINTLVAPAPTSVFADATNPTVEVLNMCFPPDLDDATRTTNEEKFKEFADKGLLAPGICGGVAQGWTVDKNVTLPGEDGKTGQILVSLISWPSVAQHMDNRETQEFKDAAPILRELPRLVKLDVFHVEAKTSKP